MKHLLTVLLLSFCLFFSPLTSPTLQASETEETVMSEEEAIHAAQKKKNQTAAILISSVVGAIVVTVLIFRVKDSAKYL